jgi:hypothetical protein
MKLRLKGCGKTSWADFLTQMVLSLAVVLSLTALTLSHDAQHPPKPSLAHGADRIVLNARGEIRVSCVCL